MKKILVPTDFSACANNAAENAINLADKLGSEIHFLHLMSIPIDWVRLEKDQNSLYPDVTKSVENAQHKLDEWVNKADKKGVKAQKFIHYNKSISYFTEHMEKHGCDLVVMGSHGVGGAKEVFLGSTAQRVVRTSPEPVIVLKENMKNVSLDKIAFASDFLEESLPIFRRVNEFAAAMSCNVDLLYVNTPYEFLNTPEIDQRMQVFHDESPDHLETRVVYNYENFEEGLMHYAKNNEVDMIVMVTHGKRNWPLMVSNSFTEYVVNHSTVPIMTFNLGF